MAPEAALQAARLIIQAAPDAPREDWEILVAIAGAETQPPWNPYSKGDHYTTLKGSEVYNCLQANCDGYCSFGLWQIYMPAHQDLLYRLTGVRVKENPCRVAELLLDPAVNAMAAAAIYRSQGFRAWSRYNDGTYRNYLGLAREAVAQAIGEQIQPPQPAPQPAPQPEPSPQPTPQPEPSPAPAPLAWWPWVVGGVGVATLILLARASRARPAGTGGRRTPAGPRLRLAGATFG